MSFRLLSDWDDLHQAEEAFFLLLLKNWVEALAVYSIFQMSDLHHVLLFMLSKYSHSVKRQVIEFLYIPKHENSLSQRTFNGTVTVTKPSLA